MIYVYNETLSLIPDTSNVTIINPVLGAIKAQLDANQDNENVTNTLLQALALMQQRNPEQVAFMSGSIQDLLWSLVDTQLDLEQFNISGNISVGVLRNNSKEEYTLYTGYKDEKMMSRIFKNCHHCRLRRLL